MNPEILKHEPQYEQTSKNPVAYFTSTTGIYSDQSSASHACQPASLHSLPSTNKLAAECEAEVPKHAASGGFRGGAQGARAPPFGGIFAKDL